MKSLIFEELLILSVQQKRARRIRFNRNATIISGGNAVGKSQVLKLLYASFGANPLVSSDLWELAALKTLLRFSVDSRRYSILRDGDSYTIFNEDNQVIDTFRKIMGGFSAELARIFDFHLEFYSQADEGRAAHPRYLFAPFYIDQDRGWVSTWSSFEKLNSSRWQDAIEYHVGIKPNSYYRAKAELRELQSQEAAPTMQRDTLAKVLDSIGTPNKEIQFDSEMEAYSKQVEDLLLACRRLHQKEEDYRDRITALENERLQLHLEMEIASRGALEFRKDFEFSTSIKDHVVECPMCGAGYRNGIAERFLIAQDEVECEELYSDLASRVAELDEKLIPEQAAYDGAARELAEVSQALNSKQQELSLGDVIKAEGSRELRQRIEKDVEALNESLAKLNLQMKQARRTMKDSSDKRLKTRVLDSYRSQLQNAAVSVGASPLPPEMLTSLTPKIPKGSSEFPRRLLAYFVSILHAIRENTSSTYCPVVIDAVNQQDQSGENLNRIYQLLATRLPSGTQLILGCVNSNSVAFSGETVVLDDKHGLLKQEQYDEVVENVRALIDRRFKFEEDRRLAHEL